MRLLTVLVAAILAGCSAVSPEDAAGPPAVPEATALPFGEPVRVNLKGPGYEPSIRIAQDGTIYITAHKQSPVAEGTRLASWLWYSLDATTFLDLPSPQAMHESLWALEGDLAIDDEGVVHFVDTYLADMTISRWRSSPQGPQWIDSRPAALTESLDDRPWLEAHGDGILYVLVNHGPDQPTPASLLANGDPMKGDRIWFYASEDGGQTWAQRHGFSASWWCGMAASQVDDMTVHVGCFGPGWLPSNLQENYLGQDVTFEAWFHTSRDRGATWESTKLADYETRNGVLYPQPAADASGNVFHVWVDDDASDDLPTRLMFARQNTTGWEVADVTPFNGSIERIWARAGPAGHVAITFYATPDAAPTAASPWHVYAYITRNATAAAPAWDLLQLDASAVTTGTDSPADFFQNAWGPGGRLHVAYERVRADGTGSDILYVAQSA